MNEHTCWIDDTTCPNCGGGSRLAIAPAPTRLAIEGPRQQLSLSPAIAALDQAWAMLREAIPELGPAVIVVQRSNRAWGHYTLDRPWGRPWVGGDQVPEIMISGENLARGARAVFGTLAHEATHYLQHLDGVKGVDVNGRHNRKFQAGAAYYFGLTVDQVTSHHGYSHTTVSDECAEQWAAVIDVIAAGLAAAAGNPRPAGVPVGVGGLGIFGVGGGRAGGRNKNQPRYVCACGHILRMGRKAWEASQPTCQDCGEIFGEQ